ncbi:MAG: DUF4055 domain-containing protein [Candidatus Adiutrix sp.]|jgi:hypothetical protein|nr:DUF4055 domain-containing protein [Candidatus Adiutrix sp.]
MNLFVDNLPVTNTAASGEDGVTAIHPAYARQRRMIDLPRTLMGGAWAMREAGERYLPRRAAEDFADYRARLNSAALDNYFARTVDYLAGQVFQKPVDYLPAEGPCPYDQEFFKAFKENVDLAGTNLSSFALDFFRHAVIDGLCFLLVDYSRVEAPEEAEGHGDIRTRAVDRSMGWRPYFVAVRAGSVLDAWLETVDGQRRLKHFRYEEIVERATDGDGLAREQVRRVRAFWPGRWQVWETPLKGGSPKLTAEGKTSLDYIPVFWFRPGTAGAEAVTADPPLMDLAEMNRVHWNAFSDHQGLMRWERSPVWFSVNMVGEDGETLPFGPNRLLDTRARDGEPVPDLRSVGIDHQSSLNSLKDLESLEKRMENDGLTVALSPAGRATATEVSAVANASDSQLKGWCVGLQDTLENALAAAADYDGDSDGPAVFVNTSFRRTFDVERAAFIQNARDQGDLSWDSYFAEIQKMGAVSDEVDMERERQRLKAEYPYRDDPEPSI